MSPDSDPEPFGDSGGPPPLTAIRRVRTALVRFVADLRTAGVEVPADGSLVAAEALGAVGVENEATVRTALRSALISRPQDIDTFDRLFGRFWRATTDALTGDAPGGVDTSSLDGGFDPGAAPGGGDAGEAEAVEADDTDDGGFRSRRVGAEAGTRRTDADGTVARFSPTGESTRTEAESLGIGTDPTPAVRELTDALATRPGRRQSPVADGRPDVRRAMRRSHGTGGVVVEVPERAPRPNAVRGLVLVDVSRSVLDTLDRGFLVRVLRALSAEWRDVRTFLFDTDVTEVTTALEAESETATLREIDRLEAAWGGGTRIGHAVTTVRETAPTVVDRDTVVLIVSDGLETGDVSQLEDGMAWLDRRARAVFWLNPLAASTEYEPACRGMVAARPHVDGLFAFAEPADLFDVARQLRRRRRPVGYEYDWRRNDR
jgi:hypothetical protein